MRIDIEWATETNSEEGRRVVKEKREKEKVQGEEDKKQRKEQE